MQRTNMGNKDKKFKKCRRKIRIRLADPNDPDSYVCEVFDSSYENEEKDSEAVNFLSKSKDDNSKPKNYFELLMSKDCRKKCKVKVHSEVEENCDQSTAPEERPKKNEILRKKRENVKAITSKPETDSSDDENLQIIKNRQSQNANLEKILVSEGGTLKSVPEIAEVEELFSIFESPKIEPNKKTLNILNYFSKTNPKNNLIQTDLKNQTGIINSKINQKKTDTAAPENTENSKLSEKKLRVNELNKENVKLAPLFYKKEKKIFDSVAQNARLNFLYSNFPIAKKIENKSNDNDVQFPEVAHIQQKNYSPCWSVREVVLPLPKIFPVENIPLSDKKFRYDISKATLVNETVRCSKIQINKDTINKLKSKYLNLNLDSVIESLKKKRDEYLSVVEKLEKSKRFKENIGKDETGLEVFNTLWVEKYKPKSSDILGNGKTLKKLRGWLESWKSFDEALKALLKSKPKSKAESNDDDDDDDAFLDSDDDDYGLKAPGNVCILSGPHASGKTALVFALASELEFKVLELNASSKRTGKKVLSDLQEATQSHKVHHLNVLQNELPQKEIKKKKKRWKKGKKSEGASKIILPNNSDCKISLILIEDADVVFEEHDEGFVSAISYLAQTSKRPLIFVTPDHNCPYLETFKKDQCLILEMERPCFYKSCAVLDVVSSLEGAQMEEEFLKHLVRQNSFDLRKSLLELQFWTQSGENFLSLQKSFDLIQLWWGLGKFLYKKDIRHYVTSKGCKRKRGNDLFDPSDDDEELTTKKPKLNSSTEDNFFIVTPNAFRGKRNPVIESYHKILDLASVIDTLCGSSFSESIFGFECSPKDGLSLEENLEEVSCGERNFAEKISGELVKLSTEIFAKDLREKKNEERKFDFLSPSWEEIRWQRSQNRASEELSALVSLQSGGDRRSLRLDYLPIIRNICRVEKSRSEQPKRNNRFYHYLWSRGTKLQDDHLDANCRILNR